MTMRKREAKTTAMIVRQGLKSKPVAEICCEHPLSQTQYDQWRDQFLANATKAFEGAQQTHREARLQQENANRKKLVGELTLELKQATRSRDDAPPVAYRRPP